MAPKKIGKDAMNLRNEVSPKIKAATRTDLLAVLREVEKKKAGEVVELLDLFTNPENLRLDDWDQLKELATAGDFFCQLRLAFTEIAEVGQVTA
jgi:hypothetical protein